MKQKDKTQINFRIIDTRYHFDFVSPYPIEECVEVLNEAYHRGLVHQRDGVQITVDQRTNNHYEFEMYASAGKNMDCTGYGELQRREDDRTRIHGYAKIKAFPIVMIALFACTHVIFVGLIVRFWLFAFMSLPMLIFFAWTLKNTRNKMVQSLQQTLLPERKAKAKNA